MPSTYGEYLAVNKLSATMSGTTAYDIGDLYHTSTNSTTANRVRRAYANDSSNVATLVWDLWDTWLWAGNFTIGSSGGYVSNYMDVESHGEDIEGGTHEMSYTYTPTRIYATTSDEDTTHTIKVTQTLTGDSVNVTATQEGRLVVSSSYSTPTISNVYQSLNIPAYGGTAYVMVNWSQTETTTYDNNTTSTSTVTGTSLAIILSGTIQQSGASVLSDGGLYKNSCGTTVTPQRTVYTVKSYKFTANGVTRTVSNTTFNIGQAANKQESTSWLDTYNISVSHSPTGNIANTGGTKTISVSSTENGKITYTSTATQNTTRNATATLSTSLGTLSTTSITGSGTSTLTVGENISAQRSITVTAKSGSTSKTTTIIQNAVVYVLTAGDDAEVNATATTVDVTFVSSRNGSPWQPVFSSDSSWATVKFKSSSGNTFTVTVTLAANTSTSTRTATITATQTRYSGSGTATLTVTQAGKAVDSSKFGVLLDECIYTDDSLSYVSYSIRFTASPSSSYTGGTASNVTVHLNTMPNGGGLVIASRTLTSRLTVNKGSTSDTYSGTLSAGGRVCYFLVYWDNKLQFYTPIEENTPEG